MKKKAAVLLKTKTRTKAKARIIEVKENDTVLVAAPSEKNKDWLEVFLVSLDKIADVVEEGSKIWQTIEQLFRRIPNNINFENKVHELIIKPRAARSGECEIGFYSYDWELLKIGETQLFSYGKTEKEARTKLKKLLESIGL